MEKLVDLSIKYSKLKMDIANQGKLKWSEIGTLKSIS
jgi:hypothetical protein